MVEPAHLAALIRQIRGVRSPVARVKLLARAWRFLKKMTPAERSDLSAKIGFGPTEKLLRTLAVTKGRVTPGLLEEAVEQLQHTDGGRIRDLVAGLKDPGRRGKLVREGLDEVERRLAEEEEDEPEPAPQPEPAPEREPEPEPEQKPDPKIVSKDVKPVLPEQPPPQPPPQRPPTPVPPGWTHRPSAPATQKEPTPGERADSDDPSLLRRIAEGATTLQRLRLLTAHVGEARDLGLEDLRELLECFPQGWSRRRALACLLRSELPARAVDAEALIDGLVTATGRRWCASILVESKSMTQGERLSLTRKYRLFRHRRAAS